MKSKYAKFLGTFLLLGVLMASIVASGCIGGEKTTTPQTQISEQPKTEWPSTLRFLDGSPGATWEQISGVFAELISKNLVPTTARTGGGVSNIINLNDGKGDLGLSGAILGMPAMNGDPPFEKKIDNVAAIANLYRQWLSLIHI